MTKKENLIYRLQQLKLETEGVIEKIHKECKEFEMEKLVMSNMSSTLGKMINLMNKNK